MVWTHPSTFKNIYQSDLSVLQICKYLLASAADFQVFFVVVLFFAKRDSDLFIGYASTSLKTL